MINAIEMLFSAQADAMRKGLDEELVPLACPDGLPTNRGWYRVHIEGIVGHDRTELWFDFGLGYIRHHSITLPPTTDTGDAGWVRIFRPPSEVSLRIPESAKSDRLVIRFSRVGNVVNALYSLMEFPRVLVEYFKRCSSISHFDRPQILWRWNGFQMITLRDKKWGTYSAYHRWRTLYMSPRQHQNYPCPPRTIMVGGVDDAIKLNRIARQGNYSWIAVVPEDVTLEPNALQTLANIAESNNAAVAYADNDHTDKLGTRTTPIFRTGFSPERLLSHDWLGPVLLFHAESVIKTGGWRKISGSALHYDLCLRLSHLLGPSAFIHIPRILYSIRPQRNTVLMASDRENVRREAVIATGMPLAAFNLPSRTRQAIGRRTSVIIPTRDRIELLRPAVESILTVTEIPPLEVIIVDNGSEKPQTLAWLEEASSHDDRIRVIREPSKFNYSQLNNRAAEFARGDIFAFLNNDIEIQSPDWLEICGGLAINPNIGCTAPLLVFRNGRIQHAGLVAGPSGIATHIWADQRPEKCRCHTAPLITRNVSALTGACMIVEKSKFMMIGGFDEANLPIDFNDVDFCFRLGEKGLRHVVVPTCRAIHHQSQSRNKINPYGEDDLFLKQFQYMREIWHNKLDIDPYFPRQLRIDKNKIDLFWPG